MSMDSIGTIPALLALSLALVVAAGTANAEEAGGEGEGEEAGEGEGPGPGEEAGEGEGEGAGRSYGHRMQGGIGILVGTGYYFEVPYAGEKCTQLSDGDPTAATNCQGMSPLFMDFQASFGITEGLEVLLEYRLGLLEQYVQTADCPEGRDCTEITTQDRSRPMAFGFGVRYYTDATNWFKFFVGALVDIDFTPGVDVDVTLRPILGLQFDFIRWAGIFIQASPTIYVLRSFRIGIEGGLGVQARFP